MDAKDYYCDEDSEMADVIIRAQEEMFQSVEALLELNDFPTSIEDVKQAVLELCRVTLAGEEQ